MNKHSPRKATFLYIPRSLDTRGIRQFSHNNWTLIRFYIIGPWSHRGRNFDFGRRMLLCPFVLPGSRIFAYFQPVTSVLAGNPLVIHNLQEFGNPLRPEWRRRVLTGIRNRQPPCEIKTKPSLLNRSVQKIRQIPGHIYEVCNKVIRFVSNMILPYY